MLLSVRLVCVSTVCIEVPLMLVGDLGKFDTGIILFVLSVSFDFIYIFRVSGDCFELVISVGVRLRFTD